MICLYMVTCVCVQCKEGTVCICIYAKSTKGEGGDALRVDR
jgi:hypothetical protein